MAKYETMLITSAALDEEASSALIGKFKSLIEAITPIEGIPFLYRGYWSFHLYPVPLQSYYL